MIPSTTALVAILDQHLILSLVVQVHHASGITQMSVEGVYAVTKVIQFLNTISLDICRAPAW